MRIKIFFIAFLLMLSPRHIFAIEAIYHHVPNAAMVGRGELSFLMMNVYQATLYAPHGKWERTKPFALSIEYRRDIAGKDIAHRSVYEIRKQGFTDEMKLADWHEKMNKIFPDVKDGTILTAIYLPGYQNLSDQTLFYQGEAMIDVVKDDMFGRYFFNIWLGEKSSAPKLRLALLGLR
ncbi:MAG: chalcone isomerase family protein [Candidatus Symbiobacter sp.]|nr:chalcone isomerase family protein [Candidatus Symbiobacter sp.]